MGRSPIAFGALALALLSALAMACDRGGPTAPEPINCAEFPPQESSPWVLPYPPGTAWVATPHIDRHGGPQRYAIDMEMPIGSPVVAMQAGVVQRVVSHFTDGDHTAGHENHIFIEHADGSVARYIHLTRGGAHVAVGAHVAQGQLIGSSGDTGNSSAPHLHFDVTACCCITPPNYNDLPCGQTRPLTFRNTIAHPCGLERGVLYEAMPY